MKEIVEVSVDYIGLSDEDILENVKMYKPFDVYKRIVDVSGKDFEDILFQQFLIYFYDNLLEIENKDIIKDLLIFNSPNLFIEENNYFLRFRENLLLKDIFSILDKSILKIHVLVVVGGAGIHSFGYRFVVHPNEKQHQNQPHVHVVYNNYSVRYSLVDFKRFSEDNCCREYIRDEKRIVDFIKERANELIKFWNLYNEGFEIPLLDEEGKQILFQDDIKTNEL